jgi:hypothetical protein
MAEVDLEELIDAGVPMVVTAEITPDLARRLLVRNRNNRVPKEGAIARYKWEMENGNWRITNQGLGFDRNGDLTDGQNRLMACIRADKSFHTVVAVGLVPEAKEVVDVGVKRTLSDALKMEGYTNAPALAGGVALRQRYEQLVEDGQPMSQAMKARSWRVYSHPAYLNAYDPRLVLRNYLTRLGATRVLPPTMIILGVTVKAWNAFRLGEPRQILALKETEIMPRML